jgi:4-hydroxy-3-methylbut-2-enyl diphosphate reductase IspH
LELINDLTQTAEERLQLINQLTKAAEERMKVIQLLEAEVRRLTQSQQG